MFITNFLYKHSSIYRRLFAWWNWGSMNQKSHAIWQSEHLRLWVSFPSTTRRWERTISLQYRSGQHSAWGAGYIGGWTIYLAIRRLNGPIYSPKTRRPLIQIGWTDNANRVP